MIVLCRWLTAGLLLVALTGCRTVNSKSLAMVQKPDGASRTSSEKNRVAAKVDPGLVRTGFTTGLTSEQRINTHFDLARALEAQGNFDGAITEYQKVIEAFDAAGKLRLDARSRAEIHRHVGIAFDRLGKFDQAREHYRNAQKLAPKNANVWNDAGYSAYLQGHWSEAESALRKAVDLDPSNPRILTNYGLALAAVGKTDAALEALTKAGGPAAAHANLAYVLAASGQFPAARKHYAAALGIQPDLEAARDGLKQIEVRLARSEPMRPPTDPVRRASATSEKRRKKK